jgi:hypothetical protein
MLGWNGSDPEPGSGLAPDATYNILYKDRDNGQWSVWLEDTNETSALFTGVPGKTYYFQARATDRAGNTGPIMAGSGDTRITVDTSPPSGTIRDDGASTGDNTRLHATITFSDPESGVTGYQYWISTKPGETDNYTFGPEMTDKRDVTVTGVFLMNGTRYYISVRALNGAGIWSPAASSDGIDIKMKIPVAAVGSPNGPQKDPDIQVQLSGTDPNSVGLSDGDIEYRVANVTTRASLDWSEWNELGGSEWGDAVPGAEPFLFHGEPGKAYRFRYRVRDRAGAFSDFAESANITRINRPPKALMTAPENGTVGIGIDLSANSSADPDGDRLDFYWDFGDGSADHGKSVTHIFSKGKTYTVTLYVDDSLENISVQKEIIIRSVISSASPISGSSWVDILVILIVVAVVAGLAVVMRRKKAPAHAPQRVRNVPQREAGAVARHVTREEALSERAEPPAPSLQQSDVEEQVTAAMDAVTELKKKGLPTDRAGKILGLATSAFADGRLETALKFSQKVTRMRDELVSAAAAAPATTGNAGDELNLAEEEAAAIKAAGFESEQLDTELDMARMFWADNDKDHAVEHIKKARALALALKEKGPKPQKNEEPPAGKEPPSGDRKKEAVKKAIRVAAPVEKAPRAKPVGQCPSCGMELEPGWKVCPACEKPL